MFQVFSFSALFVLLSLGTFPKISWASDDESGSCRASLTGWHTKPSFSRSPERNQILAADLLMLLTLEHPLLLESARNTDISEKDLFTLFHLSSGFAIHPARHIYSSVYQKIFDPYHYSRHIQKDGALTRLLAGRTDVYPEVRESIDYFRQVDRHMPVSDKDRLELLASRLYDILAYQIRQLPRQWDIAKPNPPLSISTDIYRIPWNEDAFYLHYGPTSYHVSYKNFAALSVPQLNYLKNLHAGLYGADISLNLEGEVRKIFVSFISENISQVLSARDHILKRAVIDKIGMRAALLERNALKDLVREKVIELIDDVDTPEAGYLRLPPPAND